jgi:hypothetical protein
LLFDLGLEDSLVGITKFCVHPSHLKTTKTIVLEKGNKEVKQQQSNTCFKVKNVGCSGLAKEFLR